MGRTHGTTSWVLILAVLYPAFLFAQTDGQSGYSFSDSTPRGAFETARDQMQIATDLFNQSGVDAFLSRYDFFTSEDKQTIRKTLGGTTELSPVRVKGDQIFIDDQTLGYDRTGFALNGQSFTYDFKHSLQENSDRAVELFVTKTSWWQTPLQILEVLFAPQAWAKPATPTKTNTKRTAVRATTVSANMALNQAPKTNQAAIPENGGGDTHATESKSFGASFFGASNGLLTVFNQPSGNALELAFASARQHNSQFQNKRYLIMVDYSKCRDQDSFFVVDMQTHRAVRSFKIPTAYGGADATHHCPAACSDRNGKGNFEGGAMITTGSWGKGGHTGEGIALKGLDPGNRNTQGREVKIHEGNYLNRGGNSAGCFVLNHYQIEDIKSLVTPGTFVYGANCPSIT